MTCSVSLSLTTSCSPLPLAGTQMTMYSRTFPSAGSQRTFSVLVVGSRTCRFLAKPSGSGGRRQEGWGGEGVSVLPSDL